MVVFLDTVAARLFLPLPGEARNREDRVIPNTGKYVRGLTPQGYRVTLAGASKEAIGAAKIGCRDRTEECLGLGAPGRMDAALRDPVLLVGDSRLTGTAESAYFSRPMPLVMRTRGYPAPFIRGLRNATGYALAQSSRSTALTFRSPSLFEGCATLRGYALRKVRALRRSLFAHPVGGWCNGSTRRRPKAQIRVQLPACLRLLAASHSVLYRRLTIVSTNCNTLEASAVLSFLFV